MHWETPADSAYRAYTGGGSRCLIDTVDDSKLMQESNNPTGMKGESWPTHESPQNYGFTSVVADAVKGANGVIQQCAEGFMTFIGGNRSFPVCASMDDRRHRLKNLAKDAAKGATAMFGLKEWGQQFLNTDNGMFMTGNTQKKIRMQLVQNQNGQTQQQTQQQAQTNALRRLPNGKLAPLIRRSKSGVEFEVEVIPYQRDGFVEVTPFAGNGGGSGSSGGNGGGQSGSQPTGQKTLHKEDSSTYVDMTSGSIHQVNGSVNHEVTTDKSTGYYSDNEKSYRADKGHTHIKNGGAHVWVDGACKKSIPFIVAPDGCS